MIDNDMAEQHKIKFWRGSRALYNVLKNANALDYWTRYTVKDPDGTWMEYYGSNPISIPTGQLLPVIDVVETLPTDLKPGDRYLVGHNDIVSEDGTIISAEYFTVDVGIKDEDGSSVLSTSVTEFDSKYGIRVINRGMKNYVLVDGVLKTYDDVDCGKF